MTEDPDEFRMGFMFDNDHTMKLLEIALNKEVSPEQVLYNIIDTTHADIQWMQRLLNDE